MVAPGTTVRAVPPSPAEQLGPVMASDFLTSCVVPLLESLKKNRWAEKDEAWETRALQAS